MLSQVIKILNSIYPKKNSVQGVKKITVNDLPLWILGAIDVHAVSWAEKTTPTIYLAATHGQLTFDQIVFVHKKIAEKLDAPLVLIVDDLPAKFRPLLARSRIPYVYKDQAIFAPELGLRINNIQKHFVSKQKAQQTNIPLTPFSLKIVAGILTNLIPQEFTLKKLHADLIKQEANVAISKLSIALNELARKEILLVKGAGPRKNYMANPPQDIWQKLKELDKAPLFRSFETTHWLFEKKLSCFAGETALAHYSMLADPPLTTIAMTGRHFREAYGPVSNKKPAVESEKPLMIQVWKENPVLFAFDRYLNPVELYFSLERDPDERVQMSLNEMLNKVGLKNKGS